MKKYSKTMFATLAIASLLGVALAHASTPPVTVPLFTKLEAQVTAVDTVNHAVTATVVELRPLPALACPITDPNCNGGGGTTPAARTIVITQGQALILDAFDNIIPDVTAMKVGHSLVIYQRLDTPYMVKDNSLAPDGCDIRTRVCSGGAFSGSGVSSGQGSASSGTGTTPPGTTFSPPTEPALNRDLSAGKTGDDVLLLQEKLQAMGYFPADVEPTGYFGPATKKAVVAFQEENGLPATGFVGPLTRGILQ